MPKVVMIYACWKPRGKFPIHSTRTTHLHITHELATPCHATTLHNIKSNPVHKRYAPSHKEKHISVSSPTLLGIGWTWACCQVLGELELATRCQLLKALILEFSFSEIYRDGFLFDLIEVTGRGIVFPIPSTTYSRWKTLDLFLWPSLFIYVRPGKLRLCELARKQTCSLKLP